MIKQCREDISGFCAIVVAALESQGGKFIKCSYYGNLGYIVDIQWDTCPLYIYAVGEFCSIMYTRNGRPAHMLEIHELDICDPNWSPKILAKQINEYERRNVI